MDIVDLFLSVAVPYMSFAIFSIGVIWQYSTEYVVKRHAKQSKLGIGNQFFLFIVFMFILTGYFSGMELINYIHWFNGIVLLDPYYFGGELLVIKLNFICLLTIIAAFPFTEITQVSIAKLKQKVLSLDETSTELEEDLYFQTTIYKEQNVDSYHTRYKEASLIYVGAAKIEDKTITF